MSQRRKPKPTQAEPGSLEKIEVMRKRVEDGEHLYHPQDTRYITTSPPGGVKDGGRDMKYRTTSGGSLKGSRKRRKGQRQGRCGEVESARDDLLDKREE